ncbi:class I SAM-dependent methyltransferase [Belnapia sp. T6]|uniref:Class I SAM-dependent methyltransferase n=1 Tax=Belnapia mucosa TaxID=2804532 RepID=A0ABS1V4U6_9PROT|nr:class I SAM-dependent methyltransferase [Belnapia mucosa]MBL6456699.1 class I SAM-dependent methyltransferase [Belnapia mucosa]
MSRKLQSVASYEQFVTHLLANFPEEEALSIAVGGNYEQIGVYEHALLREHGLKPNQLVVDIGCGSGRLAWQLRRYPYLRYVGTDPVPALVDYARRKVERPDFQFLVETGNGIPVADGSADLIVFFSVFTHLLPEESYAYLESAWQALRPGGKVIFSFLEFTVPVNWPIFQNCVAWARSTGRAGHLNLFLHRSDLRIWAERLGFNVAAMLYGDQPIVTVDAESATQRVPAGRYPLGQSLCVLRKPAPGEPVQPAAVQREA